MKDKMAIVIECLQCDDCGACRYQVLCADEHDQLMARVGYHVEKIREALYEN